MYLKSLTLKGFKSFADRTRMAFDPGLNVVVGPNGSGKSNVSDAILWVLGEQSAKHLRGSAMEDVIFAGSSGRAAVSVAEVDLVLDNSDHTLPIDFDEVAITRRMYRSGESEYLLNASPARLMDVQDILHDSGLGRQTHSIISQGKLDAILQARPEERRGLIEEAAGISKHKRRKERSLRRLASMDDYLKRAQDLQRTLNRQLKPLERQVAKAQRHGELQARLDELTITLAVDDLRRLKAQWMEAEDAERQASAQLDLADYQVKERSKELDRLQALLEEKGLFVGDLSEQRRRCQSLVERIDASMKLLEEKGRHMVGRLSELYDAISRSEARRRDCARELESARGEVAQTSGEVSALEDRARKAADRLREVKAARRAAEDALGKASAAARARGRERDAAAVALAKARDALENARVADDLFASRLSQIDEAEQRATADIAAAKGAGERAAARVREAKEAAAQGERRLAEARANQAQAASRAAEARSALSDAQRADREARAAVATLAAETAALERVVAGEDNRTPLAARLAGDVRVREGVRARVSEALAVPAELADLVESLLADRMGGFVVADAEALADVAAAAAGQRGASGRASVVLPMPTCADEPEGDGRELPGYALADRVKDVPGLEGVSRALLGDVRVVETLQEALEASSRDERGLYVTPAGDTARRGAVVTVGRPDGAGHGVLASRARLRELRAQAPSLEEASRAAAGALHDAEAALEEARRAQDAAAQDAARLQGEASGDAAEVRRAQAESGRCDAELTRLESALARSGQERGRVTAQRADAAAKADQARAQVARLGAELTKAEEDIAALTDEAAGLQVEADEARRNDRAAHEEANDCQVSLARARERSRYLQSRADELASELADVERSLKVSRETEAALEVMSRRVEPLHARYVALQEAAGVWSARLRDRASIAEADSASLKKTIADARAAVSSAQQSYTEALGVVSDVKVRKGRLDVQVNAAVAAITSRKGVVLEEALLLPAPRDRAADEAEVAELEKAIADIGPVNMVAMEEYDGLKAHADYVTHQVEDLQHARASLTKIISAIDRKMRASFVSTFEKVNDNFQEIFATLFPGGSGHIEMTDPNDPDETGIEVVAQPRGKRVTKMSLLSGGERSLAALGLLFAVYRTRTVPFYVLDEVEAALDDSNLDRFLGAVDMLRTYTQLIVISHQRRTMERADVLYGVSMQADGVSKVVSQRLGEGGVPRPAKER